MIDQQVIRLLPRLFAHLGVRTDISSDDRLQSAENPLRNRRRANDDPANHATVTRDSVPFDREGCADGQRLMTVLKIGRLLAHDSDCERLDIECRIVSRFHHGNCRMDTDEQRSIDDLSIL